MPAFLRPWDDNNTRSCPYRNHQNYRGAQAFELLRYKPTGGTAKRENAPLHGCLHSAIHYAQGQGWFCHQPRVCAGFETVDNAGFEPSKRVLMPVVKPKLEIVVICSSDEEYADNALAIFKALKMTISLCWQAIPLRLLSN